MRFGMKNLAPFSPEQKAKDHYIAAYALGMVVGIVLFGTLWLGFFILLRRFHIYDGPFHTHLTIPMAYIAAQQWALSRVRKAGLSQKSRTSEMIVKTATQVPGEAVGLYIPKPLIFVVLFFSALMGVASWSLWHNPRDPGDVVLIWTGIIGFPFSAVMVLAALILLFVPYVRIDDTGIVSSRNPFWHRRVKWTEIVSCEITNVKNFVGENTVRQFVFKGAGGRKLMTANLMVALGHVDEIETEIRRRLTS
jgi:hypothetical protein